MKTATPSLRVLYCEDNPLDADLTRRELARLAPEILLEVAPTLSAALERLTSPSPPFDVVLTDLSLPDGSGLQLLAHIRESRLPLAVVIITGSGDQAAAVAALKAGADDYLVKRAEQGGNLPRVLFAAWSSYRKGQERLAKPLRVLYAEPNTYDADLTRRHLSRHAPHIHLETVTRGSEVLERLPLSAVPNLPPIDVLLLDFRLPGMNALEVVKTLRQERGLDLPIVVVSGHGTEELAVQALRLGVDDYLVKHEGYLQQLPLVLDKVQKQAELNRSEARYRRLFEANPQPMWIFDLESLQFLAVNDAAIAHYGYGREEFLGMTIRDIRPPEGVPALLEGLARMQGGSGQDWTRHRCKGGMLIDVEIHAHNIEFFGRNARVVLALDVTEKRKAEERMMLDAAALMSTRDAVLVIDRTPCILSINPALTAMTGYSEADLLGEHPGILSSSRHGRALFWEMARALLKDNHWQGEVWGRRKDGETFPGWLTLSPVHGAEGKPTHFVGVMTDLTRLRKSEERLQYLANHDALTDLPKRQLLESVLQHALERARRGKRLLALLVMDLDQFKIINESFGHRSGDELLVSVVQRLRSRVRGEDTLGRLTGDQFVLMVEGIHDYSDAEVLARDLQATLEAPFVLQAGHQVYLRASIGISFFPQDGAAAQDLLRGADAAVNLAKERGGNQFCYCTSELNTQARKRLELQTELRQALEREEFVLHYQPKVDLRSGRIVGAEALLRWNCPGKGLIPPLQFVPVAEKIGLIVPLGAWVIDTACHQIRLWRDAGLENVAVSVNVSARQFRSGDLEALVSAALLRHGVEPQYLMLELTESMLMDAPEETISRLAGLRRTGVRISLDDFGTGYSSLGYLARFPIDQLKIDRSFITDIVTDPKAAAIATAVIALAHRMRLRVVAEGVETEAQLGYLRQYGCDEMQGYLFSKPIPSEAFAELLRQGKALPVREATSDTSTLLIVDDEPGILSALRRLLFDDGYRVLTAGSSQEGLEILAREAVQVIIADQRMPEMCGTEFLGRVKSLHPNTVRMVLSGYADLATVTESVNEGALYKFLAKPWNDDQLREQIREAFVFYETNIKPRWAVPPWFE